MIETDKDRRRYVRTLGERWKVRGRFLFFISQADFTDADLGRAGVSTSQPMITGVSSDLEDVKTGDVVVAEHPDQVSVDLRGEFRIIDIQPDGSGMTRYLLNRHSP